MSKVYYLCDMREGACESEGIKDCWKRYRLCCHTTESTHASTPFAERRFVCTSGGDFVEVTNEVKLLSPYIADALVLYTQDEVDEMVSAVRLRI